MPLASMAQLLERLSLDFGLAKSFLVSFVSTYLTTYQQKVGRVLPCALAPSEYLYSSSTMQLYIFKPSYLALASPAL